MGAILATKGAAWGLTTGIILYVLIESMKVVSKKIESKTSARS